MKISNLIPILFFLLCCKEQPASDEIIIEGHVKNIPDGTIYLTEAHHWKKPLFSTECKNGRFLFRIKPDSSFTPFMAAIHFPDPSTQTQVGSLIFRNHMQGPDSIKHFGDAFYLEKGYTLIEGNLKQAPYLRVFAGRETDIMYKFRFIDFGWPARVDSAGRVAGMQFIKNQIVLHPFSHFLLQSIYNAKEKYSKEEIKEILALFNADVLQSKTGLAFTTYLKNRPDPNEPFPDLSLSDSANKQHPVFDSSSTLTILAFWASWCGPCRKEIPVLKEVQKEYKKKGVKLVSISIDQSHKDWMRALRKEKMRWPQYIVDSNDIERVKQQFNFSSIPFLVFTNKNRKELMRLSGYSKDEKQILDSAINTILHKK
jgi:thiol-disulfide isomerase/thioredoxin